MNTILQTKTTEDLKTLFLDFSEDDKVEVGAMFIHLAFMNKLRQLMEEQQLSKADLAKKLKTSKSYITQLFTGDKLINLSLLARIQKVFNVSFEIVLK
jgi:DNA-binding XRE family transcriptional regulator